MFSAEDQRLTDGSDIDQFPRQDSGLAPGDRFGRGGQVIRDTVDGADAAEIHRDGGRFTSEDGARRAASVPAEPRGLSRIAGVLLADLALAVVAVVVLVVIGLQRLNGATLDARRTAYTEDLVVFFVVGAIFAGVAYLLYRAREVRVAAIQAVVAAVVLGLGGFAAVAGQPSESSVISPIVPEESPSPLSP